jgi:tRNA A37 threonylcarbamoyladenosine modification protein TsaB
MSTTLETAANAEPGNHLVIDPDTKHNEVYSAEVEDTETVVAPDDYRRESVTAVLFFCPLTGLPMGPFHPEIDANKRVVVVE